MANWFEDIYGKLKPEEDDSMLSVGSLEDQFSPAPMAPRMPASDPVAQPAPLKPIVRDYLMERKKLEEENKKEASGPDFGAALAAIGAGFQGKDSVAAAQSVKQANQKARENKLSDFDKKTALEREEVKFQRDEDTFVRETDPNSPESQVARELAMKLGMKNVDGLTAEKFKALSPVTMKMWEIEQRALDRKDAKEERRFLANITRNDKLDARAEKRQDKEDMLAVPGYERTGEVLQKPEEAQKIRKATANAEQLQSKLNRLREIVSDKGSFEYGGDAGQEMDSLATEIQLLSKGEDMYSLGVLTGPDLKLLEKITASPTSMDSLFTRDSTRKKQIDSQLKSIQDKLNSVTKASGYRSTSPQVSASDAAEARRKRIAELKAKQEKRAINTAGGTF